MSFMLVASCPAGAGVGGQRLLISMRICWHALACAARFQIVVLLWNARYHQLWDAAARTARRTRNHTTGSVALHRYWHHPQGKPPPTFREAPPAPESFRLRERGAPVLLAGTSPPPPVPSALASQPMSWCCQCSGTRTCGLSLRAMCDSTLAVPQPWSSLSWPWAAPGFG